MKVSFVLLFVALYAILLGSVSHAALTEPQLSAMDDLCALLNTTLGWDCQNDACGWSFISCDVTDSSVLRIAIEHTAPGQGLMIPIPESIGNLSTLVELKMSGLGLVSPLPSNLLALNSLQNINLTNNKLDGAFPDVSSLSALEMLDISNNEFSGVIPPSAFLHNPSIKAFVGAQNAFSGDVSFASNIAWEVIDMSNNDLDLCQGNFAATISGTQKCDFTSQVGFCGSCASSWTQCMVTASEVDCASPIMEPGEERISPDQSTQNLTDSVVPLVHCWEMLDGEVYGYFGYETTVSTLVSAALVNVTNGIVDTAPETVFEYGRWPLSIIVMVENISLGVTIQFGIGEVQKLEISETTKCPNISLVLSVMYPNATNMDNLTDVIHDLYAAWVPYPAELLTVGDAQKRAFGDFSLTFASGASASAYQASVLMINRPLPSNQATGNAQGVAFLKTSIPTSGGSVPPSSGPSLPPPAPARPPSFTASAKGAISICIIVGVLIVGVSIWILIVKSSSSLPIVGRDKQDKSIRVKKKKLKNEDEDSDV